eukprot:c29926_g1_i1 orf=142-462(+)
MRKAKTVEMMIFSTSHCPRNEEISYIEILDLRKSPFRAEVSHLLGGLWGVSVCRSHFYGSALFTFLKRNYSFWHETVQLEKWVYKAPHFFLGKLLDSTLNLVFIKL